MENRREDATSRCVCDSIGSFECQLIRLDFVADGIEICVCGGFGVHRGGQFKHEPDVSLLL